jgi:hypothetical protein
MPGGGKVIVLGLTDLDDTATSGDRDPSRVNALPLVTMGPARGALLAARSMGIPTTSVTARSVGESRHFRDHQLKGACELPFYIAEEYVVVLPGMAGRLTRKDFPESAPIATISDFYWPDAPEGTPGDLVIALGLRSDTDFSKTRRLLAEYGIELVTIESDYQTLLDRTGGAARPEGLRKWQLLRFGSYVCTTRNPSDLSRALELVNTVIRPDTGVRAEIHDKGIGRNGEQDGLLMLMDGPTNKGTAYDFIDSYISLLLGDPTIRKIVGMGFFNGHNDLAVGSQMVREGGEISMMPRTSSRELFLTEAQRRDLPDSTFIPQNPFGWGMQEALIEMAMRLNARYGNLGLNIPIPPTRGQSDDRYRQYQERKGQITTA